MAVRRARSSSSRLRSSQADHRRRAARDCSLAVERLVCGSCYLASAHQPHRARRQLRRIPSSVLARSSSFRGNQTHRPSWADSDRQLTHHYLCHDYLCHADYPRIALRVRPDPAVTFNRHAQPPQPVLRTPTRFQRPLCLHTPCVAAGRSRRVVDHLRPSGRSHLDRWRTARPRRGRGCRPCRLRR